MKSSKHVPRIRRASVLISALIATGCAYKAAQEESGPSIVYHTERISITTQDIVLHSAGILSHHGKLDFAAPTHGTISEIAVRTGDRVKTGDFLGRVENHQLKFEVKRRKRELESRKEMVELSSARMDAARRSVEEGLILIRQAAITLEKTQREHDRAAELLEQTEALHDAGGASSDELTAARLRHSVAESAVRFAETELSLRELGFRDQDLAAAGFIPVGTTSMTEEQRLDYLVDFHTAGMQTQHRIHEHEKETARIELQRAEHVLAETEIRSPIDGIVAYTYENPGEAIAAETRLFTVFNTDSVKVSLPVPSTRLPFVSPGQSVVIRTDHEHLPEYTGTVRRVAPFVSPETGNREVVVDMENPDHTLIPGMFVRVEIIVRPDQKMVLVPRDAVLTLEHPDKTRTTVLLCVQDNRVFRVPVEVFERYGERVRVEGDFSEGRLFLTRPHAGLADGSYIEVKE
jgi:RND family efflux transporter MFP subunit